MGLNVNQNKILITGTSGFIGKNLRERLSDKYDIFTPSHNELDLLNKDNVRNYINVNKPSIIIHCANIDVVPEDKNTYFSGIDGNLRMFFNLMECSKLVDRIFYFGSGAEYNHAENIENASEDALGKSIPLDPYGFSKYIMAQFALRSSNIYDLVLFGVYGKYENYNRRFISNNILQNKKLQKMSIHKDCWFDYVYVEDMIDILEIMFNKELSFHRYNLTSGQNIKLSEIAKHINNVMGTRTEISIEESGYKPEYTSDNSRLLKEIGGFDFTNLDNGINDMCLWLNDM